MAVFERESEVIMEIQTFLLCKEIQKTGTSGVYNANHLAIHNFYPTDGVFPLQFSAPFYMLLRRQQKDGDEQITLRFDLVDQDGRNIGQPENFKAAGIFPSGHGFLTLTGHIGMMFPKAGEYRLDITADEDKLATVYAYNIEVTGTSA